MTDHSVDNSQIRVETVSLQKLDWLFIRLKLTFYTIHLFFSFIKHKFIVIFFYLIRIHCMRIKSSTAPVSYFNFANEFSLALSRVLCVRFDALAYSFTESMSISCPSFFPFLSKEWCYFSINLIRRLWFSIFVSIESLKSKPFFPRTTVNLLQNCTLKSITLNMIWVEDIRNQMALKNCPSIRLATEWKRGFVTRNKYVNNLNVLSTNETKNQSTYFIGTDIEIGHKTKSKESQRAFEPEKFNQKQSVINKTEYKIYRNSLNCSAIHVACVFF